MPNQTSPDLASKQPQYGFVFPWCKYLLDQNINFFWLSVCSLPGKRPKKTSNNKGSAKRHRYTFAEKVRHIESVENHLKLARTKRSQAINVVAGKTGVPCFTLTKWFANRGNILSLALDDKKRHGKSTFNRQWLKSLRNLEEMLANRIRKRRRLGLKASRCWIMSNARQILKMPSVVDAAHAPDIMLSRSWYYKGFLPRANFSIRRSSNRKQAEITDTKPAIYKFHSDLFAKFNAQPHIDPVYGHYSKRDVFNFDQIPLPFICDGDNRTVDEKGAARVWCRQPGSGLEKRQATMHLTLCEDDDAVQPKPVIIFRGTGKNIQKSSEVLKYIWLSSSDAG